MRKIVAGLFTSLDGVVSSADGWHVPYLDGEVMAKITSMVAGMDAMLFGGRTYDEFAGIWANQSGSPSADYFNAVPKYVVTSRTTPLGWDPATQLAGGLKSQITGLKAKPGGAILVQGSPTLVRSLLREGLLDELNLLIMPVLVGGGLRLFDGVDRVGLSLIESQPFGNGVIRVSYRPENAPDGGDE